MPSGSLALVLHAHLPFVRHPEHDEFFEEDWLFEAISESYLPLLNMMQRLVHDGVPFKLTLGLTPPLCAMLQDELLRTRYLRHLDRTIRLAGREIERTQADPARQELATFYHRSFTEIRQRYLAMNCDLLGALRHLRDVGVLEIIASAATHGVLPLLTPPPEAVRAQVAIGCDAYREIFHAAPTGFWLPECAYTPGLEKTLQEANLRWFIVDAHAFSLAKPKPRRAVYAPCFTAEGPAAFARDPESSRQVWSAESGYPGAPVYREFYRDLGFDLPPAYVFEDWVSKTPRFCGLKFHRITSREPRKELYQRAEAENAARMHAEHFLASRLRQLEQLPATDFAPIITMPFDAELFGHWWYEGPIFLEHFIRQAALHAGQIELTTPSEYLACHPTNEVIAPASSSWGDKGYLGVWLDSSNAWIYPHLHAAARRMVETARAHAKNTDPTIERALRQVARELLLMQSSDWAFLIRNGTARTYAERRTNDHISRFNRLYQQLKVGRIDEVFLSECEGRDNLFPNLQWRHYL
ncbi:MAG TPA: 1,4-alpha-glucan branching protein domain-containing protein [Chthoniobacterales bacterium]|nr:1,4-alpha-glucan branching protein domain-containing protein [Chthoniobacterales bacterium]